MSAYALVLFDVDGCTAIVDSKKLCLDGKTLVNGQHGHMKLHREKLKVEILQLSDSKKVLNEFEDEWSTSHRSIALDNEKKKRKNRPDGYLSVWPHDMDDAVPASDNHVNEETPAVQQPKPKDVPVQKPDKSESRKGAPKKTLENSTKSTKEKANEKTGSKGRKITVLYEGSGDFSTDVSEPQRAPCYLEELSADEQDLVQQQIHQHQNERKSIASQTDEIVMLGPDDVLPTAAPNELKLIMKLLHKMEQSQKKTEESVKTLSADVQERHQFQREIVAAVKTLSADMQHVKKCISPSSSDLTELVMNNSLDVSVDTALGLEKTLTTRKETAEKEEMITVHLGLPPASSSPCPTPARSNSSSGYSMSSTTSSITYSTPTTTIGSSPSTSDSVTLSTSPSTPGSMAPCTSSSTTDSVTQSTSSSQPGSVAPSTSSSTPGSMTPSSSPSTPDSVAPCSSPSTPGSVTPSTAPSTPGSVAPSTSPSTFDSMAPCSSPSTPGSVTPSTSSSTPGSMTTSTSSSTTDSVTPSTIPSTPGSVAPSTIPSTPGSVGPCISSSTPGSMAPITIPSTPGSVAPSTIPSTPDSVAPSTIPSTPGSMAPCISSSTPGSVAPSTIPSTPGSVAPSTIPSTPGSVAPSTIPSTPGSVAPSTIPSTPGSVAPCTSSSTPGSVTSSTDSSQSIISTSSSTQNTITYILTPMPSTFDTTTSNISPIASTLDTLASNISTSPSTQNTITYIITPTPSTSNCSVPQSLNTRLSNTSLPDANTITTSEQTTIIGTTSDMNSTTYPTSVSLPQASTFTSPTNNRKSFKLDCYTGPIIEIEKPEDMHAAPDNAEVRIKQRVTCEISANACSKQNFGWLLTQTIYKKEELYGRNVFGNRKNIIAISPRRRHALKHAVAEVYGLFDANWKEAVNGINTGLRAMRRRLPFTAVDGNIQ